LLSFVKKTVAIFGSYWNPLVLTKDVHYAQGDKNESSMVSLDSTRFLERKQKRLFVSSGFSTHYMFHNMRSLLDIFTNSYTIENTPVNFMDNSWINGNR